MIVKDLVESKELMVEETSQNVVVLYERFDNLDCVGEGSNLQEKECDPEEFVQILAGCSGDSLTSKKTYRVGENFNSVEEILFDIRENYSHLLK
ncbi:hypothetical protein J2S74_003594 [Evansella vedderi]|uniref:Uncharacterized protein n=1 Tax=Evansella vedderi TaxID=38282 RepID=A0ABT9ZY58_9BACI|nr:hypothetical protein [Evansella vedderi]MDQ0256176.1 hypothetical protein [Evansella vedderi]